MFPLGMVLFPGAVLPLHVFEPRYRAWCRTASPATASSAWSSSSGGARSAAHDVRTDVGTVARILEAEELPDGRWVLATVGVEPHPGRAVAARRPVPRAEVDAVARRPARRRPHRGLRAGDRAPAPGARAAGRARRGDRALDRADSPTTRPRARSTSPRSRPSARSTSSGCWPPPGAGEPPRAGHRAAHRRGGRADPTPRDGVGRGGTGAVEMP